MPRKPASDRERSVIEKQIEAKATEGQNFKVPDIQTLEEDRPRTTTLTSSG